MYSFESWLSFFEGVRLACTSFKVITQAWGGRWWSSLMSFNRTSTTREVNTIAVTLDFHFIKKIRFLGYISWCSAS